MKKLNFYITTLLILLLCSCVGTVEEFSEQTQKTVLDNPYDIRFDGILEAKATAHDKVRVYFKPAQGGSGVFSYNAYVDGNYSTPKSSTSFTQTDESGNIYIDIKGLKTGRTHTFLVRAYDIKNDTEDKNNITLSINTLPFEVPIFNGIHTLENVAGLAGETSLRATWIKATAASEGSGFGDNPRAISGYNIYVGTTNENMVLYGTISDPDATNYVISGLKINTKYFVKILARDSQTPVNLEDANLEIKSLSTKSAQPISFLGVKSATIPNSTQGFSKINLSWESGTGAYDRYRIFVKTNAANPDPEVETAHSADITDLTTTNIQITVTNPYTLYYVTVVACNSSVCDEYEGEKVNLPVTTTPPVAPFNGIINLEQASGQFGLTQLEASWISPDTTQGVFDEVRLFQMDNVGNNLGEIEICTSGSDPCYEVISATKRKIINLTQGTEYCFMAKAYSTTPYKADEPNGRTHINEITRCATPAFKEPGFIGPHNTCDNITSTSLSVNWDQPSPTGTYEKFEIYYTAINTPFDFTQAIAGNTDYTKVTLSPDSTSWNITGLNPATNYQFGIKTYLEDLDNPGTGFRDTNIKVINCQTNTATASHGGWFNVNAFGPKVDGRNGVREMERYRKIDFSATPKVYQPYPQEYPIGDISLKWPDDNAVSNTGMVVLKWDDFEIDGIAKMYDLIERHPENGYNIYRKEYNSSHETFPPQIADVSITALSTWTKVNDTVIKPERIQVKSNIDPLIKYDRDIATFVDYSVENISATETKTYWYIVVATLAGKNVSWTTTPTDGLLEVVLPPKNMTFMHRWMANQTMCDVIKRPVDRENNYRCEYNGLASIFDSAENKDYYDIETHLISTRFGLGANFTKGNCKDVGYSSFYRYGHYNVGNIGTFDGVSTPGGTGDCIGSRGHPEGQVEASTGDIFFDRVEHRVFINSSGGSYISPIRGTNWTDIRDFEYNETISSTKIITQDLASQISTSNSHMPQLKIRYSQAQAICHQYKIDHKGIENSQRLLRRKEQMALFQHLPYLDDSELGLYEEGRISTPDTDQIECNKWARRGFLINTDLSDQDYSASGSDHYTIIGGRDISGADIFGISNHNDSQLLAIGSSGPNSTEMCVSKFGVQDHTGGGDTLMSDTFWPSNTLNGFDVKYVRDLVDPSIISPRSDWTLQYDSGFIEDWKSANGHYYHTIVSAGNNMGATSNSGNQEDNSANIFYNPIMGIYLSCQGTSCIHNAQVDDNQLFSTLSSGSPATYLSYRLANTRPRVRERIDYGTTEIAFFEKHSNWWNGREYSNVTGNFEKAYTDGGHIQCALKITPTGN